MDDKDNPLGFEQLIQNVNNIAQILSRLTADLEDGGGLLFQPLNSLLTSISALSATLTTNNLIMGSGLGTVAAKTLSEVIDANASNAQGDILYRGAALWGVLAPGTAGQFLKTQGAAANVIWANALATVTKQIFTGSGTYTPTTGMIFCIIEAVGGGAGGGGAANSTAGNQGSAGGGGGGSYARLLATAATIGASQTVTIGGSVAGGVAGNNNGTAGIDTSVGTLCIGKGGGVGGGAASNASGAAGAGGVAGTGDFSVPGGAGDIGHSGSIITVNLPNGKGGASGLGFGLPGPNVASGSTGAAGGNYGAGGGGGYSINGGGAQAGGTGAAGIVVITEYIKGL